MLLWTAPPNPALLASLAAAARPFPPVPSGPRPGQRARRYSLDEGAGAEAQDVAGRPRPQQQLGHQPGAGLLHHGRGKLRTPGPAPPPSAGTAARARPAAAGGRPGVRPGLRPGGRPGDCGCLRLQERLSGRGSVLVGFGVGKKGAGKGHCNKSLQ